MITIALAALGGAVAYGKLSGGQEDIKTTLKEVRADLKKFPEVYVSKEVYSQLNDSLKEHRQALGDQFKMVNDRLADISHRQK